MNLSRRKMLGTSIGGLVAGPDIARGAMQTVKSYPPALPPAVGYNSTGAKAALSNEYTLEQIAKMKRLASGDIRDEDRNYPTEGNPCPFRALRSVSDNAQHFMRATRWEKQWRERTIKTALDALDHYDKTGILRSFF